MSDVTQVLRVELTSEEELFFMHVLQVNEEDFQTLKVDQGIVVDFLSFPEKIASLLERCTQARRDLSHRQASVIDLFAVLSPSLP